MNFDKLRLVFYQFYYVAGAFRLIFIYLGQITCSFLEALCLVLMPIGISRFLQASTHDLNNNSPSFLNTFNSAQISIALIVTSCAFASLKFFLADFSVKYSENLAASLTLDVSKYLFCQSSIRSIDDRGNDGKDKLINSILSCIPDVFRSAYWSSIDLITSLSFLIVVFVICTRIFGFLPSVGVLILSFSLFWLINIPARRVKANNALINDFKSALISTILVSASGYREINYSNSFNYYQSTLRHSVLNLRRTESINLKVVQYLNSLTSAFPFLLISFILLMPLSLRIPVDAAIFLLFSIQRIIPAFSRFGSSYLKFFSSASSINTLYGLTRSLESASGSLFAYEPTTEGKHASSKSLDITESLDIIFFKSLSEVNLISDIPSQKRYIFCPGNLVQITGASGLGKSFLLDTFSNHIVSNPVSRLIPIFYLPANFVISGTTCRQMLFLFNPPVSIQTLAPYFLGFRLVNDVSEIDSFLSRHPSILSSGQATRIAIIRALLSCPRLLLIDEALSTLNVEIEASVLSTIFKFHSDIVVASVTHRPLNAFSDSNFNIFNIFLRK